MKDLGSVGEDSLKSMTSYIGIVKISFQSIQSSRLLSS